MKFKRNNIIWAIGIFVVCSGLLSLGPTPTSWSKEFAIFDMKIAVVLSAIYVITTDNKNENNGG